jgi:hypothetical protein
MDRLEDRPLFAANPWQSAVPLNFLALNDAQVSHFLARPTEVDLYSASLQAGDELSVAINTTQSGGGLSSLLRVFAPNGTALAVDDQQGGDPHLIFQAATAGTYYIGVSSAPNDNDNPLAAGSGTPGGSTGLYSLSATLAKGLPLQPDLTGSSFRTGADMAAAGDTIPVSFTVQNRGAGDPGQFQVQVLLDQSNLFNASSRVLATFSRAQLTTDISGRSFSSPSGFRVALPAGWAAGPAYLGLRIVPDASIPEAGQNDKSGVHRGSDWEPLTVVSRTPAGATDLSVVDPNIRTETLGTLGPGQMDAWTFTVAPGLGNGELKVEATSSGSLPRLTISSVAGQVIAQSDSGQLVQSLVPGMYVLSLSGTGARGSAPASYKLSTAYVETSVPFAPLDAGAGTAWVAVGDLTNDGITDIVTGNRIDNTVSVFLGNGDGTFAPALSFPIGARVWRITLGDVNGDGKLDILTANKGEDTVGVLLGNGDGTFRSMQTYPVAIRPGGVAVADLTGDGVADLVVSNYASDTIGILMGNGDGTFQPQQTYPTNTGTGFAGPGPVAVADINGDGIPDLIYPNYISANVAVRLGKGNGTFGAQTTFAAGKGSYSVKVVDLNGDGKLDIVDGNAVDNTVSVLLGNGNGTFQPQKVYPVGFDPYSMTVADVNGDGKLDVLTANRGDNTVSVLLSKGDGTFEPEEVFPTGKFPRSVAVGDLNGDGKPDVVTANQGTNTVSILLGNGDGTFSIGGQQSVPAPNLRPFQVAIADLTGNGIPDIVTANRSDNSVSVLLGNPDGSFQTKETYSTGRLPISVAIADITGDGIDDIITANYGGNTISVLAGNGDGTFQPHRDLVAGSDPYDVKVADLAGDGKLDLVVTNKNDNTVGVLMGNGNGTFQPMVAYPVASGPYEVVVDDLTGNHIPDLVVSHFSASVVDVLIGNGNGSFQRARTYPVGARPYGLAVADLAGDGVADIVTANYHDGTVSVLMGNGDGSFRAPVVYPVGKAPNEVQLADLSGDGIEDIVTANYGSNSISVLMGNGDGTFQPARSFAAGSGPASLAIADLFNNGKLDVVVGNRNASTVGVLMGDGNGNFQPPLSLGIGPNRYSATVADLTGDGKADIVITNVRQGTVTVLLGNGDGTFEPGQTFSVGSAPTAVVVADVNGDGRPDLVVANSGSDSVSVLLGNGDGTFSVQRTFGVGRSPRAVVVADLRGDGVDDIITANYNDNTVSVLAGTRDGTFHTIGVFPVGDKPYALALADLKGDSTPELVIADSGDDTVTVLRSVAGTLFGSKLTYATGRQPRSVAVGDLTGTGVADIVTGNAFDDTVSVLIGNGDGTFQTQHVYPVGSRPYSVALADLNGDGRTDIVTTNYGGQSVSVLLNAGDGTFLPKRAFTAAATPVQSIVADVNGDGRPDLITMNNYDGTPGVLIGKGNGAFQPLTGASGVGLSSTPLLADLNGDGIADSVVLDRSGNILFRKGLSGSSGGFAPPVILNPGRPARAIAIVPLGTQLAIAAADAKFDPTLSSGQFVFTVSIYSESRNGSLARITAFSTPALPTGIAVGDLTGNGLDDLVVANALDNSVTIAMQVAPGIFSAPATVSTGAAPSAIALADVNGDRRPDIIVSDQASGDITVLLNDPGHSFKNTLRFRASTNPYSLDTSTDLTAETSFAQSVSLVAGDFLRNGRTDVAVVNQAAHSFTILAADATGGFANPALALTTSTSDGLTINERPGAIVAGDFNRDGLLDVAVLMEDTGEVWIFSGTGRGTFRHTFSIAVGDEATGLSVVPGAAAGLLNLLVGNGFGDVLILQGKGDGTFQIAGNRVSLSVVPNLLGPGQAGVLVGNQQQNHVTVQAPSANGKQYTTVQTLGGSSASSQLAPGDVEWAVLRRNTTLPDAIVVSTGSNAVVVYRTTGVKNGVPSFGPSPQTLFVGSAPVSVTVADINGDGVPDMLIANQGSNDVSVIFGSYDRSGNWVGTIGPRLKAGGIGPIGVDVRDLNGDGIVDLAVMDGGSGTITMLTGVGQGFFDDRHPKLLFNLGSAMVQPPTFVGKTAIAYAVTAAGQLLRFDVDHPSAGISVAYSAQPVLAAEALSDGLVVAAVADGSVKVLAPQGNQLVVATQLQAQGSTPALPSTIEVVNPSSGHLDVLVSSQGSDTVFVFAQGGASSVGGTGAPGPSSPDAFRSFDLPTFSPSLVNLLSSTGVPTSAIQSGISTSGAGLTTISATTSTSPTSTSSSVSTSVGLSLGMFSSVGLAAARGSTGALLVAVEGNTYFSVPLLDFGQDASDEGAGETGRMPWLSTLFPVGDTSPLTRFVIGLDEALKDYRGVDDALRPGGSAPARDPWREDLFHHHNPAAPMPHGLDANDSAGGAATVPARSSDRTSRDGANPSTLALSSPHPAARSGAAHSHKGRGRIPPLPLWERSALDRGPCEGCDEGRREGSLPTHQARSQNSPSARLIAAAKVVAATISAVLIAPALTGRAGAEPKEPVGLERAHAPSRSEPRRRAPLREARR